MSFSIIAPKVVAGESYYSGSIIARQAFTVTVRALNSDGSTDTSYSGIATLYANSATNDRAYNIRNYDDDKRHWDIYLSYDYICYWNWVRQKDYCC